MRVIYKQKGKTPLQSLEGFRSSISLEEPVYATKKLSYAGRLDPMAEGVMLVLVDEENMEREKYLGLDKTYLTEILFGISTDTGDVLGLIGKISNSNISNISKSTLKISIQHALVKSVGKFSQKYPAYSSKSFDKDYKSVQEGGQSENFHDVEIYSAELLDVRGITADNLLAQVNLDIQKVSGDFRQAEIRAKWEDQLDPKFNLGEFAIAQIRLKVSSGFYVRQFAEDLGKKLQMPALALSILRERVGDYALDSIVKK